MWEGQMSHHGCLRALSRGKTKETGDLQQELHIHSYRSRQCVRAEWGCGWNGTLLGSLAPTQIHNAWVKYMQVVSDDLLRGRDFHLFFRKLNQKRLQNCNFVLAAAHGFHYAASREITDISEQALAGGCVACSLFSSSQLSTTSIKMC